MATQELSGTVVFGSYYKCFISDDGQEIPFNLHTIANFLSPERVSSAECTEGRDGFSCFPIPEQYRVPRGVDALNYIFIPSDNLEWDIDYENGRHKHKAIASVDFGTEPIFLEKVRLVIPRRNTYDYYIPRPIAEKISFDGTTLGIIGDNSHEAD